MKELKNISKTLLDQLYNKEGRHDKEKFLIECLEDELTRETYVVFLVQVAHWERLINKDLYEFGISDIQDFFANNFSSSHTALRTLFSVCKQYGNWAVKRGLNVTGTNPFNTLSFKKDILPMINSRALAKEIISEEQLWEIINLTRPYKNAQDLACAVLPFYGIKGIKNAEIVGLLKTDINENNLIKIRNEKGDEITRTVQVPKPVMDLLVQASGEKDYMKIGKGNKENTPMPLVDSPFIIRPVDNGKNNSSSHMIASGIAARTKKTFIKAEEEFNRIKKELENDKKLDETVKKEYERIVEVLKDVDIDKISINNIYNSGKIHLLKQMEAEKGAELDFNDYKKVNELFGEKISEAKIINYDNIKTLYEIYTGKH